MLTYLSTTRQTSVPMATDAVVCPIRAAKEVYSTRAKSKHSIPWNRLQCIVAKLKIDTKFSFDSSALCNILCSPLRSGVQPMANIRTGHQIHDLTEIVKRQTMVTQSVKGILSNCTEHLSASYSARKPGFAQTGPFLKPLFSRLPILTAKVSPATGEDYHTPHYYLLVSATQVFATERRSIRVEPV
jgi:hypothetical protein